MAFNILSDGMPIGIPPLVSVVRILLTAVAVYQGQEQHMTGNYTPYNRGALWTTGYNTDSSLYTLTATLNKLRNHAISIDGGYVSSHSQKLYVDGSTYVTRKGSDGKQIVSVFSNQGSGGGKYQFAVHGGFAPNTQAMEVLGCSEYQADGAGDLTVGMDSGEARVFFPVNQLNGSGLCGFESKKSKSSNSDTGETTSDNSASNESESGSSSSSESGSGSSSSKPEPGNSSASSGSNGNGNKKSSAVYVSVPLHMLFLGLVLVAVNWMH
jgi:alpha-amylase